MPIPVDKQIAVTIWRLATNIEYRTISALFGLVSQLFVLLFVLVSRSQTQTDAQGLIACSISARAVRVWGTDTAKFVLATTQNCEAVDWLKGLQHLWMFVDCRKILNVDHVFLKKWLLYSVAFVSKH